MANYENGLDTKEKILDACRVLFYLKGFEKTTFKDIGESAKANQGLIVYYYKNKNVLANTIFQSVMTQLMKRIQEYFSSEESLVCYFISDFLYFRMLYEDEYFRRFVESCCNNGILNKNPETFDEEYKRYYDEMISFMEDSYIFDDSMRDGLLAVYEGMKDSYSLYICRNYSHMTTDAATINYITLYCHLLDIPREIYGERMLYAQLLANHLEVSIRNFCFEMKKRY